MDSIKDRFEQYTHLSKCTQCRHSEKKFNDFPCSHCTHNQENKPLHST